MLVMHLLALIGCDTVSEGFEFHLETGSVFALYDIVCALRFGLWATWGAGEVGWA